MRVVHVGLGSCECGCLGSLELESEVVACHPMWVLETKFRSSTTSMDSP